MRRFKIFWILLFFILFILPKQGSGEEIKQANCKYLNISNFLGIYDVNNFDNKLIASFDLFDESGPSSWTAIGVLDENGNLMKIQELGKKAKNNWIRKIIVDEKDNLIIGVGVVNYSYYTKWGLGWLVALDYNLKVKWDRSFLLGALTHFIDGDITDDDLLIAVGNTQYIRKDFPNSYCTLFDPVNGKNLKKEILPKPMDFFLNKGDGFYLLLTLESVSTYKLETDKPWLTVLDKKCKVINSIDLSYVKHLPIKEEEFSKYDYFATTYKNGLLIMRHDKGTHNVELFYIDLNNIHDKRFKYSYYTLKEDMCEINRVYSAKDKNSILYVGKVCSKEDIYQLKEITIENLPKVIFTMRWKVPAEFKLDSSSSEIFILNENKYILVSSGKENEKPIFCKILR
ncbi:hypothetical protein [Fusobacterium sp.]|uniref:hypothetical protein n=1 Tax=Fusobacterium sp. TaxID=68766 RepID=UPI000EEA2014|nr:hypothetical protein [Fusobacterium sp.]HCE33031.1 hypothetical protein [Fusobacterium sp.]